MRHFDVCVIGGGLLGCFAARNLRRWHCSVLLVEAREDVCTGISRANSAIVYPGYDHKPGTVKAEMTVWSNAAFSRLCEELDVPFSRCGSLMLSYGPNADAVLRRKYAHGLENGVPDLRLISGREACQLEPAVAPGVSSALFAPSAGTVNTWELCIAAYENALQNGAESVLSAEVQNIVPLSGGYRLETSAGSYTCSAVINCAGICAHSIQALAFPCPVTVVPNAGDYLVLDPNASGVPSHIIQAEPEDAGKGLTAVPTVEGSLLLGPSERDNTTDYATAAEGLDFVRRYASRVFPQLSIGDTIRSFAALRPNPQRPDGSSIRSFVIEQPAPNFWSLIGVKTPGMTCADALGAHVAAQAASFLQAEANAAFSPRRAGITRAKLLSPAQRRRLVEQDPDYGEVLCRCEDITRAEVLEAVRRGAVTLDGLKHRLGTGMGACQGARCRQKLTALLARELDLTEEQVTCSGGDSAVYGGFHGTL
ncbi:MAG: NAD(P)/FAD-dependent oxidoreductase [Oscillospiraceae bacterium]|nr:NAD(P)/FAD-dependent oxidoreductase [Oscillospiraceae bacterium]